MNFLGALGSGRFSGYGLLALRVMLGAHLIQGTQDNVFSWDRMLEFRDFLAAEQFPLPLFCAVVSVAAQFGCGVLYLLGGFTRWAALVMLFNFTVALLVVHLGQPYAAGFPALVMWVGSLTLLLSGPGAVSVDARREDRARGAAPAASGG